MMQIEEQYLWQYVEKWARIKPDTVAIIFEDTRLTWAQLADAVDRTARAFIEIGVEKGDCIAMVSMARPEFLIAFMAASKVSAIWTGVS
ncbi:MAG: AMP-binding protein, partial [Candidatus Hydrogenedentes bacterium]|nr:AMP-binding protein [Candidatus Hydrogenedentota bacterium]